MKKISLLLIITTLLSFMNINTYAYELSLPNWRFSFANIDSEVCEVEVDKETVHSGKGSLKIHYKEGWVSNNYLQAFPEGESVDVGEPYIISFWAKSEDSMNFRIMWDWSGVTEIGGTFDWKYFEFEYTPTINSMLMNFIVDQNALLWIDDLKICAKGDDKNLLKNGDMEQGDYTPPAEASDIEVEEHDGMLNFTWTAPRDEDYYEVAIYEVNQETNVQTFVKKSGPDVTEMAVDGLTNGALYTYLLKTVDKYGNISDGSYVFGTPVIEPVYARNISETYNDKDKILKVNTDITNNSFSDGFKAELIAAVYDTENKLIGINGCPIDISLYKTENYEIELKGIDGKYTLELYLWNSASDFCPIMRPLKVKYIDYYVSPTTETVKVKSKSGSEQIISTDETSDVEDIESIEIMFDVPVKNVDNQILITDLSGNEIDITLNHDGDKCTLQIDEWLIPGQDYVLTIGTGIESIHDIAVENEINYVFRVVSGEIVAEITNVSAENFLMSPGCFEKFETDTVYDVHIVYDNFTGKTYDVPVVFAEYKGNKLLGTETDTFTCVMNKMDEEAVVKYSISNPSADSVVMYVAGDEETLTPISDKVLFDDLNPQTSYNDMVVEMLNEEMVDYVTNHAGENVTDYNPDNLDLCVPKPVEFKWEYAPGADSYTLTISQNEDMTDALTFTTSESVLYVDELFMGTDYYYQIEASADGESIMSPVYEFATAHLPRAVRIDNVSNVRDIGGYYVNGGKQRVRQGMAYRGGAFEDGPITDEGIDRALNTYKIKTELDFRGHHEGISSSVFPAGTELHDRFIKYPIFYFDIMKLENLTGENAHFKDGLRDSMKLFADEDNYPIYFHCHAGRDRTGTFAIILETLLGMDEVDIFTDFELTEFSRHGDWVDYNGAKSIYNYLRDFGNGTPAKNTEKYLLEVGVTQEEIDAIKEILLEDVE